MDKHCAAWTSSCVPCIKRKSNQPKNQGLPQSMSTGAPFARVAMDHVVGLTCTDNGNTAILTAMDVFTRWPFAAPCPDTKAETTAKILWDLVISVHGPPKALLSDRGPSFTSDVIRQLSHLMGIKKLYTMPYWPRGNGHCERFHRFLSATLTFMVNKYHTDWDLYVNAVLWIYRISCNESTGVSPFFALYGRTANINLDLILNHRETSTLNEYVQKTVKVLKSVWSSMRQQQERLSKKNMQRLAEKRYSVKFEVNDPVFLFENNGIRGESDRTHRSKLTKDLKNRKTSLTKKLLYRLSGPHRIHSRIANNAYRIVDSRTGLVREANVAYLKLFNPWSDDWESDRELITQEFEALELTVSKNDICVIRFEQLTDEDPPWCVGKILEKNTAGELVVQYFGNYGGNIWGKNLPGWVDTKDNLHYFAKKGRRNSIPYTNRTSGTTIRISDIAYSGIELNGDGSLSSSLLEALRENPETNWTCKRDKRRRKGRRL